MYGCFQSSTVVGLHFSWEPNSLTQFEIWAKSNGAILLHPVPPLSTGSLENLSHTPGAAGKSWPSQEICDKTRPPGGAGSAQVAPSWRSPRRALSWVMTKINVYRGERGEAAGRGRSERKVMWHWSSSNNNNNSEIWKQPFRVKVVRVVHIENTWLKVIVVALI